jgi:Cu+-exporting ATPase
VSGDSEETTRAVAEELGVDQFLGRALPQDKVRVIKTLQGEGHAVGMVRDGFNDAAALAQAEVGFALGSGANLTQEASDMTLLTEDPSRIIEILDLPAMTVRTIRQNLLFAFFYNAIGIPIAVAGLLNPLIAVFAMFTSSLTVIGNSLRILRRSKDPTMESLASVRTAESGVQL